MAQRRLAFSQPTAHQPTLIKLAKQGGGEVLPSGAPRRRYSTGRSSTSQSVAEAKCRRAADAAKAAYRGLWRVRNFNVKFIITPAGRGGGRVPPRGGRGRGRLPRRLQPRAARRGGPPGRGARALHGARSVHVRRVRHRRARCEGGATRSRCMAPPRLPDASAGFRLSKL